MKRIMTLLFLVTGPFVIAQMDTTKLTLDLLRAPSSPGSVMLGIAESDIQRPTDPTEFMLTIRQASNNFSGIPLNYAVDIAPFLLIGTKRNAVDMLALDNELVPKTNNQQNFCETFKQTFLLSIAMRNLGVAEQFENSFNSDPQMGIGVKGAIFRGQLSRSSAQQFKKLHEAINGVAQAMSENALDVGRDATLQQMRARLAELAMMEDVNVATWAEVLSEYDAALIDLSKQIAAPLNVLETLKLKERSAINSNNLIVAEAYQMALYGYGKAVQDMVNAPPSAAQRRVATHAQSAFDLAKELKITRVGWFWDYAGGMSLVYRERRFDNTKLMKAGGWTSFGRTIDNGAVTLQGQLRYLLNYEDVFVPDAELFTMGDVSTIDGGGRISWESMNGRFAISTEAIYRRVINVERVDPTWRVVANAEYDLGTNRRITFSFGRNFNSTSNTSGNLVAALNLLLGFGRQYDRIK